MKAFFVHSFNSSWETKAVEGEASQDLKIKQWMGLVWSGSFWKRKVLQKQGRGMGSIHFLNFISNHLSFLMKEDVDSC